MAEKDNFAATRPVIPPESGKSFVKNYLFQSSWNNLQRRNMEEVRAENPRRRNPDVLQGRVRVGIAVKASEFNETWRIVDRIRIQR